MSFIKNSIFGTFRDPCFRETCDKRSDHVSFRETRDKKSDLMSLLERLVI